MADWTQRFSLKGKRALVTGATKGIGREIVSVFLDAGASVVAVGRNADELQTLVVEAASKGHAVLPIEADLASVDGARNAAAAALAHFGTVDILVNNAAIALLQPILETDPEDWDRIMAVNLRAPFLLAQAVAPGMIAQRAGKIVNISSQTGVIATDDHAAYASSKGGLNALTKSMTAEWARYNIQANAICPTVVLTQMGKQAWGAPEKRDPMLAKIPAGRFGEPVEIADMALYLASPASNFVNGAIMMIEGGFTSL